jgi:hypothetical protein
MEHMGRIHSRLKLLVGGDSAIAMVADQLNMAEKGL